MSARQAFKKSNLLKSILINWLCLAVSTLSWADGPKDNIPSEVRPIPPLGIEVPEKDQQELTAALFKLNQQIQKLRFNSSFFVQKYLPDVEIFHRAVEQALLHQEFYSNKEIANAKQQLIEGLKRAEALLDGRAPWASETGFVVRGFRSKIDDTVQPYGLEIPENYHLKQDHSWRCDLWFHGRGEKVTETAFIQQRKSRKSKYDPQQTIVLHPYGRYSNAFKFAGEIDVLEALAHVKQHYRIDPDRISVRGFSMGGAGCWQMAAHYPDMFFAANPGAGFSETKLFLKVFQNEELQPTWYEQKLWQLYDCPEYAENFHQLPVIAYSGEIDRQKQAADVMQAALKQVGITLPHIIGPDTAHQVHPESAKMIDRQMAEWAEQGRMKMPMRIRFETPTLRYPKTHWLHLTGLQEHWQSARVDATIDPQASLIKVTSENVSQLELKFPQGDSPFAAEKPVKVQMHREQSGNKQELAVMPIIQNGMWKIALHLEQGEWLAGTPRRSGLQKRPGLQGPIDDAFMDRFIVVKPTGKAWNDQVGQWSESECQRFINEWRRHFRGDARIVEDVKLNDQAMRDSHLILFGDPGSNHVIRSLLTRLPIQWDEQRLKMGHKKYDASQNAPIMIYPNPDQPERYIVINSGFTFREYAYLNNARQVPMLPDWAVIDLSTPSNSIWPGKVVDANFFDESWQWK